MKKNYTELGITIDDSVLALLNRAVQLEGRQSKLARVLNVPEATLSIWRKNTQAETTSITWDQWKKVRAYLIKVDLIDADDPKWMLPSQMRERLVAIGGGRGDDDARRLLYLFSLLNDAGRSALLKTAESMSTTPGLSISDSASQKIREAE